MAPSRVVVFSNARFQIDQEVPAADRRIAARLMQFVVPNLPVGYLSNGGAASMRPGETEPRTSNQLALVVGPQITTPLPITVARDGAGNATITLDLSAAGQAGTAGVVASRRARSGGGTVHAPRARSPSSLQRRRWAIIWCACAWTASKARSSIAWPRRRCFSTIGSRSHERCRRTETWMEANQRYLVAEFARLKLAAGSRRRCAKLRPTSVEGARAALPAPAAIDCDRGRIRSQRFRARRAVALRRRGNGRRDGALVRRGARQSAACLMPRSVSRSPRWKIRIGARWRRSAPLRRWRLVEVDDSAGLG